MKRRDLEHAEQVALFQWAAIASKRLPDLALLFAIPNGGHRHKATAARLKAEGVKPGVPDMFLPIARRGRHGLFIEMKSARGTVSATQSEWAKALRAQGYAAEVCRGWENARKLIEFYLSGVRT